MREITTDDYAKLHVDYTDDADLYLVADLLDSEHGCGMLVWLYWPHMIATAKKAKSFGWFRKAPKMLAQELNDHGCTSAWEPRRKMYELLVERKRILVHRTSIVTASEIVDIRLAQWDEWQSQSSKETSRMTRERKAVKAGKQPSWTVSHIEEFRHAVMVVDPTNPTPHHRVTETDHGGIDTRHLVTIEGKGVTTRDKTNPLPPTDLQAMTPDERERAWSLYRKAVELGQQTAIENYELELENERLRSLHATDRGGSLSTPNLESASAATPGDTPNTTVAGSQPREAASNVSGIDKSRESGAA